MELSSRLQAVAGLVSPGSRTADIGTDHAYIPIDLIQKEIAPLVIAMDVREGPLIRARENIERAGLSDRIQTRLSDGFEHLHPQEADAAVLSGMGGALIIRILETHWEVTESLRECILQPQSEISRVRAFLLQEGFSFLREEMVMDDGKYYPIIKVAPPKSGNHIPQQKWDETELRFGKLLLEARHPVLKQFLKQERRVYRQILENLRNQRGERSRGRRKELKEELKYIEKGLSYYEVR